MNHIKEPKKIDFSMESTPWNDDELKDFRLIMNKIKSANENIIITSTKGKELKSPQTK